MLLHIDGLRQSIDGHEILHDVHLSLGKGEIYGLIGPNGAGKSTTIAAALGLLTRDAGRIEILGHDPQTDAALIHARLGVLPEQNGFYDWMSAPEYLGFFADLYGRHAGTPNIEKCLARVGLSAPTDQPIGTFSRGMRQRLGLARALVPDPQLLILDEPTNGLDPRGRRGIHDILSELAAKSVGILLCTHILDDVERLCHRIGIIVEGRTVAEGGIAELVGESAHRSRFRLRLREAPPKSASHPSAFKVIAHQGEWWSVSLDPAVPPEAAWREAVFSGWQIIEIEREGGGLEDFYLALTEGSA